MHSTAASEKFALGEAEALQSSGFFDFDLFTKMDVYFVRGVVVLIRILQKSICSEIAIC